MFISVNGRKQKNDGKKMNCTNQESSEDLIWTPTFFSGSNTCVRARVRARVCVCVWMCDSNLNTRCSIVFVNSKTITSRPHQSYCSVIVKNL